MIFPSTTPQNRVASSNWMPDQFEFFRNYAPQIEAQNVDPSQIFMQPNMESQGVGGPMMQAQSTQPKKPQGRSAAERFFGLPQVAGLTNWLPGMGSYEMPSKQ